MTRNTERHVLDATHIDDAELGRSIVVGTYIGIPLVFGVSTLLALRVGVVNAMAVAVLPTLFSGSFVGGLILLMRALRRAERRAALLPVTGDAGHPRAVPRPKSPSGYP